jgi:Tfp pilus assembly ATPase PilU
MGTRGHLRFEPAVAAHPRGEGLPHLLQVAAAQGASVLYVAVNARPSLRVDGEIRVLEHERPLTEALLEEGLKAILPDGLSAGDIETCDVAAVGRVQCLSFRDSRGLGAMFKMLPARAISSEQMGLGGPIQALCTETEGLVLVAGARGAGKSTLVAALVDQINRMRCDHVITVEQQIQFVHDNRQSFVSQREAHDDEAFAEGVRSALREGPDVLVVDQDPSLGILVNLENRPSRKVDLDGLRNGRVIVDARMSEVQGFAPDGSLVRVFGTLPPAELIDLAKRLRPVED